MTCAFTSQDASIDDRFAPSWNNNFGECGEPATLSGTSAVVPGGCETAGAGGQWTTDTWEDWSWSWCGEPCTPDMMWACRTASDCEGVGGFYTMNQWGYFECMHNHCTDENGDADPPGGGTFMCPDGGCDTSQTMCDMAPVPAPETEDDVIFGDICTEGHDSRPGDTPEMQCMEMVGCAYDSVTDHCWTPECAREEVICADGSCNMDQDRCLDAMHTNDDFVANTCDVWSSHAAGVASLEQDGSNAILCDDGSCISQYVCADGSHAGDYLSSTSICSQDTSTAPATVTFPIANTVDDPGTGCPVSTAVDPADAMNNYYEPLPPCEELQTSCISMVAGAAASTACGAATDRVACEANADCMYQDAIDAQACKSMSLVQTCTGVTNGRGLLPANGASDIANQEFDPCTGPTAAAPSSCTGLIDGSPAVCAVLTVTGSTLCRVGDATGTCEVQETDWVEAVYCCGTAGENSLCDPPMVQTATSAQAVEDAAQFDTTDPYWNGCYELYPSAAPTYRTALATECDYTAPVDATTCSVVAAAVMRDTTSLDVGTSADEEQACSLANPMCIFTAAVAASCNDNENWYDLGATNNAMNANPIYPVCDTDILTYSGEFQAYDECAYGCTESFTGCPAGMEWATGDECHQPPALEPELFNLEDQQAPDPGCANHDGTEISEPLWDKTGCDDECTGGAYIQLQPFVGGLPGTCTGTATATADTCVGDTASLCLPGCTFTAGVAGQDQVGICVFCNLVDNAESDVRITAADVGSSADTAAGQWEGTFCAATVTADSFGTGHDDTAVATTFDDSALTAGGLRGGR